MESITRLQKSIDRVQKGIESEGINRGQIIEINLDDWEECETAYDERLQCNRRIASAEIATLAILVVVLGAYLSVIILVRVLW